MSKEKQGAHYYRETLQSSALFYYMKDRFLSPDSSMSRIPLISL